MHVGTRRPHRRWISWAPSSGALPQREVRDYRQTLASGVRLNTGVAVRPNTFKVAAQ
jgi:hypothetical protein